MALDTLSSLFPWSATTDGVTVRVMANFLPEQSDVANGRWFWAYQIRIENHRDDPIQLLTRHWQIYDGHGGVHYVDGDGVIGEQPLIAPGKAYDYVSGCPLNTSSGSMVGRYAMVDHDGNAFDIAIPRFPLQAPTVQS